MKRRCPICGELLENLETDWTLLELKRAGHAVATIGTANNARADIASTVEFQIASNLAAYDLDYDFELNFGFRGRAWGQCPQAREQVTCVTFPR